MKQRKIWLAACGAIALGTSVAVLAQDPQSTGTASQSTSAKTITVSGCVSRAQNSPTGTTGSTAASTTAETKFVLTNASLSTKTATGTSGTTAAPPATAIASEYKLDADDTKLTEHVGHKVEITGTVEPPTRAEQQPPASAANSPTLKVQDVKMVSTTCQ